MTRAWAEQQLEADAEGVADAARLTRRRTAVSTPRAIWSRSPARWKNDGQNDKYHSIDNYMSIVQQDDSVANGGPARAGRTTC